MNPIIRTEAAISKIVDLTSTAKEVTFTVKTPVVFLGGNFMNILFEKDGTMMRRAYSLSSDDTDHTTLSFTIRHTPDGMFTPQFWKTNCVGKTFTLMGPLGIHTADTLKKSRAFLFGFGVGTGVIKSVALSILRRSDLTELTIVTGSRNENDIVHKDFFDQLVQTDARVKVLYAVSAPTTTTFLKGYIQDHVDGYQFDNSDIYICGQTVACDALVTKIKEKNPQGCTFAIEAFH